MLESRGGQVLFVWVNRTNVIAFGRAVERLRALPALLAVSALAGCVGALPTAGDGGLLLLAAAFSRPAPWWNQAFAFRRQLSLTAAVQTPSGYSVSFDFDHASLVAAHSSLPDAADLRLVHQLPGAPAVELDRVADTSSAWNASRTRVWFRTQASIEGNLTDSNYYAYYGYGAAPAAPAAPAKVFAFFDEFDDSDVEAGWSSTALGGATCGAATESGATLTMSATQTGTLNTTTDVACFTYRSVTGDFFADTVTASVSPAAQTSSQYGGVMLRASPVDASSIMAAIGAGQSTSVKGIRTLQSGTVTVLTNEPQASHHRLVRIGTQIRFLVSADGLTYSGVSGPAALSVSDPVLVGPYLAFALATSHSVGVERFLLRPAVFPEPALTLGIEEQRP